MISRTLLLLLPLLLAASSTPAHAACDTLFKVVLSTNKTLADTPDVKEDRLQRIRDVVRLGMLYSVGAYMPLHSWGLPDGSDIATVLQVAIGSVDEFNTPMTILPVELQDTKALEQVKQQINETQATEADMEAAREESKQKLEDNREELLQEQADKKDKGIRNRQLVTALEELQGQGRGNLRHRLAQATQPPINANSPICPGATRDQCIQQSGAYNCHAFCGVPLVCDQSTRRLADGPPSNMASHTFYRQLTQQEENSFAAVESTTCAGIYTMLAQFLGAAYVKSDWKCALVQFEEKWV